MEDDCIAAGEALVRWFDSQELGREEAISVLGWFLGEMICGLNYEDREPLLIRFIDTLREHIDIVNSRETS
jgi:hypothetical protein